MNATLRNRAARVRRMMGKNKTRRVKRQEGRRYLVKPGHIRFSNRNRYSNENNTNNNNETWNYNNILKNIENEEHMRELVESRKSVLPSFPEYGSPRLNPNQAKRFANLLSRYNDPNTMVNALSRNTTMSNRNRRIFRAKIREMFE